MVGIIFYIWVWLKVNMVVVGKHVKMFAFSGLVVEIPTKLLKFKLLLPFQRQPRDPNSPLSSPLFPPKKPGYLLQMMALGRPEKERRACFGLLHCHVIL